MSPTLTTTMPPCAGPEASLPGSMSGSMSGSMLRSVRDSMSTALPPLARPCLLLAALPAGGLMACTALPALVRGVNPASADVLLALITLPLWLCLLLGYAGLMAAGRLDRWLAPRVLQAPALVVVLTALCWLSGRAAMLQQPGQTWLAFALPLLALGAGWALAFTPKARA